jgi:threonine synthase
MLQQADLLARATQHAARPPVPAVRGPQPSGSFKDNGMTAAFTHARMVGAKKVACASTGNTSASLAMFARFTELRGHRLHRQREDLDRQAVQASITARRRSRSRATSTRASAASGRSPSDVPELGIYLMNSVNPFRLEGQKSIMLRILEAMGWEIPDWIIVPRRQPRELLGVRQGLRRDADAGLIKKVPRLAVINAAARTRSTSSTPTAACGGTTARSTAR